MNKMIKTTFMLFLISGCDVQEEEECRIGSEECQCTQGNGCDTGLICVQGTCEVEGSNCLEHRIGDENCDQRNNNAACEWDGGDCCSATCVNTQYTCGAATPYNCLDPNSPPEPEPEPEPTGNGPGPTVCHNICRHFCDICL
jgi:hypothetical protein